MKTQRPPSAPSTLWSATKARHGLRDWLSLVALRLRRSASTGALALRLAPLCTSLPVQLALALVVGYATVYLYPHELSPLGLGLAGGSFALLYLRYPRNGILRLGVFIFVALWCHSYYWHSLQELRSPALIEGQTYSAQLLHPPKSAGAMTEVRLLNSPHRSVQLRLSLDSLPASARPGDCLQLRLERLKPLPEIAEHSPSYASYLTTRGFSGQGSAHLIGWSDVPNQQLLTQPIVLGYRLQATSLSSLERLPVSTYARHCLAAMLLGYSYSDDEGRQMRAAFRSSGVAHLLAVSGFHLVAVVLGVQWCLSLLCGSGRYLGLRRALTFVSAWAFALLTGCSIPTLRAALLLSLYLLGKAIHRPMRWIEALALALLIQLILVPYSFLSASLILTYCSLLSIYLYYPPLRGLWGWLPHRPLRWCWEAIALNLSTLPLLLPYLLHTFGTYALGSLYSALLIVPLASVLITLSLPLLPALLLGLPLPSWALLPLDGLCSLIERLLGIFARFPQLTWESSSGAGLIVLCYAGELILSLLVLGLSRTRPNKGFIQHLTPPKKEAATRLSIEESSRSIERLLW